MKKKILVILLAALLVFTIFFAGKAGGGKQGEEMVSAIDMTQYQLPGTKVIKYPIKWEPGVYGGTFNDTLIGDPKTFNDAASFDNTSTTLIGMMFDYLFETDPNTKDFKGQLVESYEVKLDEQAGDVDPDLQKPAGKMDIVCKLRKDVKWWDGKPFTADDVVYYLENVILNENIGVNGMNSYYLTMPNGEDEPIHAEKVDTYTVVFHFPRIIANPLLRLSFSPLPKHIIEPIISKDNGKSFKSFWSVDVNPNEIVGDGPWMLEKYVPNSLVVFKKNPNYYMKDSKGHRLPYFDQVVYTIVKDQNTELLQFQSGQTDIYGMRGEDFKVLQPKMDELGIDIWSGGPTLGTTFFTFNQNPQKVPEPKLSWFSNKKFRQAFSCLIDRQTIVANVMDGIGAPQLSPTPVQSPMYDPNVKNQFTYDPEKAKALLAEIGIKDRDGDGFLEDEKGNIIEFEMNTNAGNNIREQILNLVADEAKKIGLKVAARPLDFNLLVQKLIATYEWDCIEIGLTGSRYPESGENVWLPSGALHMWYPRQEDNFNPYYDWELEIVKNFMPFKYTVDKEKRKVYWSNILKVLVDELPLIYTVQGLGLIAVKKDIGNFYYDTVIGYDLRRLYWKKK